MIVKIAKLFELAGYVMAGSSYFRTNLDLVNKTVPGYGPVKILDGHTAFPSPERWHTDDAGFAHLQGFLASEIAESRPLLCPHCKQEWSEQCNCNPVNGCLCFSCVKKPAYFESARDREAEKARDQYEDDRAFLIKTFGLESQHRKWVIEACNGDLREAACAARWSMGVKLPVLVLLDNAASMPRVALSFILKGIETLGLPELLDPYGQPLKKLHQARRLLHAAWIAGSYFDQ